MRLTPEIYRSCADVIDYSDLAVTYRQTLRNYVERGGAPGSAIQLALEGNVRAVIAFHDPIALKGLVKWIFNQLPDVAWGSPEKVRAWMAVASRQAANHIGV